MYVDQVDGQTVRAEFGPAEFPPLPLPPLLPLFCNVTGRAASAAVAATEVIKKVVIIIPTTLLRGIPLAFTD